MPISRSGPFDTRLDKTYLLFNHQIWKQVCCSFATPSCIGLCGRAHTCTNQSSDEEGIDRADTHTHWFEVLWTSSRSVPLFHHALRRIVLKASIHTSRDARLPWTLRAFVWRDRTSATRSLYAFLRRVVIGRLCRSPPAPNVYMGISLVRTSSLSAFDLPSTEKQLRPSRHLCSLVWP